MNERKNKRETLVTKTHQTKAIINENYIIFFLVIYLVLF